MPEESPVRGRLDSWKEIAAYLNRDVRTVIRWEREKSLPIHRVPGGKRQAVFAYKDEIEAWLLGQQTNGNDSRSTVIGQLTKHDGLAPPANREPEHVAQSEAAPPALNLQLQWDAAGEPEPRPAPPRAPHSQTWKLAVIATSLLALIWIAGTMLGHSRAPTTIGPLSIKQLTDGGPSKGYARTDGTTLYFGIAEGARSLLGSAPMSGGPIHFIDTPFANAALQDLSNDGKTLLIISFEGIVPQGPLWTVPAEGGPPRRIGDVQCSMAKWSSDNRQIACVHKTQIVLMNADGSNPHTIASFPMPVRHILWNPDGKHLRYVLDDTAAHAFSQWQIGITPDDSTTQAEALSLGPGCCLDWTWTRDGKTFVYILYDAQGKSHLMLQPGGSGPATELPVNIGTIGSVASGQAANALYLSIAAGSTRSELLKFDARRATFETMLPGLSADYLAFSPDGQWMTYTDTNGGSLWRGRADGDEVLQLVDSSWEVQVSSWSPDGQRIAFMGRRPGKPYRIYLIDRDGGVPQEASDGDDNQGGPSWSPDGKSIVYGNVFCELTQNCWIHRLDLATRKTELVPGSNGFRTARWSPDGKYIAALKFQARELMLFDVGKQRWRMLANSVAGDNIHWSSDSQFVFVDSPRDTKPVVERVRIRDGHRTTIVSLALLQNVPGALNTWFGLTRDNSPILSQLLATSEIYELRWRDR